MDLNEMRRRFKEQKAQKQNNKQYNSNSDVVIIGTSSSNSNNENVYSSWNDATQKAVNLMYLLEKCSNEERRNSLAIINQLRVPSEYTASWNQILRIWKTFVDELQVNTKVLPNPDGVRYDIRPYPIIGSSGIQDLIKEIIKNS